MVSITILRQALPPGDVIECSQKRYRLTAGPSPVRPVPAAPALVPDPPTRVLPARFAPGVTPRYGR